MPTEDNNAPLDTFPLEVYTSRGERGCEVLTRYANAYPLFSLVHLLVSPLRIEFTP